MECLRCRLLVLEIRFWSVWGDLIWSNHKAIASLSPHLKLHHQFHCHWGALDQPSCAVPFLKASWSHGFGINLLLLMCVAFIPYPTALIWEFDCSVVVFTGCRWHWTGLQCALVLCCVSLHHEWGLKKEPFGKRRFGVWAPDFVPDCSRFGVCQPQLIVLYVLIPLFYLLPGIIDKHDWKVWSAI